MDLNWIFLPSSIGNFMSCIPALVENEVGAWVGHDFQYPHFSSLTFLYISPLLYNRAMIGNRPQNNEHRVPPQKNSCSAGFNWFDGPPLIWAYDWRLHPRLPNRRQGCQVPVTLVNQNTHSLLAPAFQKGIVAIMATWQFSSMTAWQCEGNSDVVPKIKWCRQSCASSRKLSLPKDKVRQPKDKVRQAA